ncbi:histidine phosphatase family protein [uncultured Corynebacterium sp.]|uniref:histidine phosphatase family protein n=1 Tax=uncultured Corynebacterium sp. TaxID=159447 RepID=UPI0025EF9A62|nr:histidine phosphatase family protein [uncultured Corynebacterium sp.]
MSRLLLIRHGQTTSNVTHSLDTSLPGAALTELGRSQAYAAGERIAGEYEVADTLILASSQALRARQTARGIVEGAAGAGLVLPAPDALPGISEIPAGEYEMRSDDEAQYHYHRYFGRWLGGSLDLTMPGALTGREVVSRYLDTLLPQLAVAQATGSDLAVVSHGAVIRLVAGFLGRVDPEWAVRSLLPNTSRVELEVPELGWGTPLSSATLPTLPTVDAPMLHTAAWVPEADVAAGMVGETVGETLTDVVSAGWKVTEWGGHGEPPRVG